MIVAGLAFVLANPACFCCAETAPSTEEAPVSKSSCCDKKTGPINDAPEPLTPAPCDCDSSVDEALAQGKMAFSIPDFASLRFECHGVQPVVSFSHSGLAPTASEFRGPPLRHLHSVYRL